MTLTPAIKEALDSFAKLSAAPLGPLEQDYRNVLSVVAAEEGRKYAGKIYTKEDAEALCEVTRAAIVQHYEPLVKLVKEWQEAGKEFNGLRSGDSRWAEISQRWDNACDALAQWEAK